MKSCLRHEKHFDNYCINCEMEKMEKPKLSDKDAREEARKRFEAYEINVHTRLPRDLRRPENGNYWSNDMQQDWELWQAATAAESQRTQAPSETRTKLLKIAAKVARREYMPSLENCRTISDARIEVRRMDDLHAQLAWELKTVLGAVSNFLKRIHEAREVFSGKKGAYIPPTLVALEGKETNG